MKKGGGAPFGNKNGAGNKKLFMSNLGGLISGAVHKPEHRERASEVYKKRGAGLTGYKVGVGLHKLVTFK